MLLEPGAEKAGNEWSAGIIAGGVLDVTATNATSLLSIAISLKRIADEVCGVPYDHAPGADNSKHHAGITAGIQMAIEQALLAASQRG